MGLDLWFSEDCARLIASKLQAALRNPDSEWRRGYIDAMEDMSVAFGLSMPHLEATMEELNELED